MSTSPKPQQIADRIVDAILARKLAPGARLGEQPLADLFGVSRTVVREALTRLAARGMVEVNTRRGWFIVQPSPDDAREAFSARQVIETGLLQTFAERAERGALKRLKAHVAQEQAAIKADDAGERSYLLGDFHVCLAGCAGNSLLADILRDLTARTTLIATLYQSPQDAVQSCREHALIVGALERGQTQQAIDLMREHIGSVAQNLGASPSADPLDSLRTALAPLNAQAQRLHTSEVNRTRAPKKLFSSLQTPPNRSEK